MGRPSTLTDGDLTYLKAILEANPQALVFFNVHNMFVPMQRGDGYQYLEKIAHRE